MEPCPARRGYGGSGDHHPWKTQLHFKRIAWSTVRTDKRGRQKRIQNDSSSVVGCVSSETQHPLELVPVPSTIIGDLEPHLPFARRRFSVLAILTYFVPILFSFFFRNRRKATQLHTRDLAGIMDTQLAALPT
jgi:hypothetical protein